MSYLTVIDEFGLVLPLVVDVGLVCIFAVCGLVWRRQVDKIVPFAVPMTWIGALAALFVQGAMYDRDLVIFVFLLAWSAWQAGFLLARALKRSGSDTRSDSVKQSGPQFAVMWIVIAVSTWTQLLPFTLLHSPIVGSEGGNGAFEEFEFATDYAGVVILAIGTVLNVSSDLHKYIWLSRNRNGVMRQGAWATCRHPSYFGHVLMLWGVWIMVTTIAGTDDDFFDGRARAALWASVVGPIFFTLFTIFVLVPTAERAAARQHMAVSQGVDSANYQTYQRYVERTSPLIPFPSFLYRRVPAVIQKTVFLDFASSSSSSSVEPHMVGHKLPDSISTTRTDV
ncbi:hypothetical protein OIV83_003817 [Microbotryomycetes sp. JL201]|nr:hypothetical protein OIV83_003817 [Microbotryomycetes sp. JL201]